MTLVAALVLASIFIARAFTPIAPKITKTLAIALSQTSVVTKSVTLAPNRIFTPVVTESTSPLPHISYGPDLEQFPPGINPLTGLPACKSSLLKFPAVIISITHFPASARPQAGLSFSPIIFEIYISEGMTRFLAVFYGECPHATVADSNGAMADQIGPIRSPRPPSVGVSNSYQDSCLVYASATQELLRILPTCKIVYGSDAKDINSAFLSVTSMEKIAQANVQPGRSFNYSGNLFSDMIPSGGQPANLLKVYYNLKNQTQWTYDPTSGHYMRSENDPSAPDQFIPATDRLTAQPLAFSNIIVMFANHKVIKPTLIDIDMRIGTVGDAYLFRDGQVFKIRWTTVSEEYEKTTGLRRPIRFIDEAGNPVALKPGHTWVHLMTPSSTVNEQTSHEWLARFYAPAGAQ